MMADAYTVEIVGRSTRRQAEALALELSALARQYQLRVARFTVEPVASTSTAEDPIAGSPGAQQLERGLGLREPERHFHLSEERHGGGEAFGRVGTTEEAG